MTDASLASVVFVAFAALTVRCTGPSSERRIPRRPASGIPIPRPAPRMRAPEGSRSHVYGAPPPDRGLAVPLEPRPRRSAPDTATPQRGADPVVGRQRAAWEAAAAMLAPLTIGRPPGCSPRACSAPWTPCAPPAQRQRTPSSASRPAPARPPARSASSTDLVTSTASNPARSWSPGPPPPPGRRCLPALWGLSPTAAPCHPCLPGRPRVWHPRGGRHRECQHPPGRRPAGDRRRRRGTVHPHD